MRLLKNIFGSDSLALSTMLTVFIGGIAIGAFLSGRLINRSFGAGRIEDRYKSLILLLLYAVFEFVLGFYALMVPSVLGQNLIGMVWDSFAGFTMLAPWLAACTKFVFAFVLLIIPTLLMGLGFPLLSELLVENHKSQSKDLHQDREILEDDYKLVIGNLYATNTMGSILGALACGFFLLPYLGLRSSVYLGAGLNFAIVLILIFLLFVNRKFIEDINLDKLFDELCFTLIKVISVEAPTKVTRNHYQDLGWKRYRLVCFVLLAIAFAIGFVNLSMEILWTKLLSLVIGSSTYSLTIILVAVLSGISMGAYALNYLVKNLHRLHLDYLSFLKSLIFVFAVLVALSFSFFNKLPWLFLDLNQYLSSLFEACSSSQLWLVETIVKFIVAVLIVFPVTFVEGVIFAFVLFLISSDSNLVAEEDLEPVGARVAKASYCNTLGAILGSFLTGFVLLPVFSNFGSGIFLTSRFFVVFCFLMFLLPLILDEETDWLKNSSILVVMIVLALWFMPNFEPQKLISGVSIYQGHHFKNLDKHQFDQVSKDEILFHKEGVNSIITVVRNTAANAIFLKSNGKIEAGKPIDLRQPSKADMVTQVLLGTLPIVINPDARKAMLIGMGSGISLKSLAVTGSNEKLERVDVCELEKLVYEAADKFFVSKYPARPQINRYVIDARNFVQAQKHGEGKGSYDIIISQPSDPWLSGALFTYEFWSMAEKLLSERGIFVQWLQLYSLEPEYLNITLRTFQKVFPEMMIFQPGNAAELLLIGAKTSYDLDMKRIQRVLSHQEIVKELQRIGIESEADLFSNLILDPQSLKEMLQEDLGSGVDRELAKKSNFVRFVKNVSNSTNLYKPTLTKEFLDQNQNTSKKIKTKINARINTDNNMMLEFHVSKKLQDFYATIAKNINVLAKYSSADNLIEFFAESATNDFLFELAKAHASKFNWGEALVANNIDVYNVDYELEFNKNLHGKLAEGIAEAMQLIAYTPGGFLALHEVYKAQLLPEKAEAALFEAITLFSDAVTREKRGKQYNLVIFDGLLDGKSLLTDYQLYSLAYLYFLDGNNDFATDLLTLAIDTHSKDDSKVDDNALQKYKLLEFNIQAKALAKRVGSQAGDFEEARLMHKMEQILSSSHLKASTCSKMAKIIRQLIDARPSLQEDFEDEYVSLLNKSLELNASDVQAHLLLGEYYYKQLPHSQIEIAKEEYNTTIDKAIIYLKSALELSPFSVRANYYMSQLQYRIANVDLAYKHSQRLNNLCALELLCTQELSPDELKSAQELSEKLNKLLANK